MEYNWKRSDEELPILNLKLSEDKSYRWLQSDWVIGYWPNMQEPYPKIGVCCFQKSAELDEPWMGWFNEMLEECNAPESWAYVTLPISDAEWEADQDARNMVDMPHEDER